LPLHITCSSYHLHWEKSWEKIEKMLFFPPKNHFFPFPPKIRKFWGKMFPWFFPVCTGRGSWEMAIVPSSSFSPKKYLLLFVFLLMRQHQPAPPLPIPVKKCMKKGNVSLINPTLSDLRCFLSDLNLLHKVHFWIFLWVLFFRKSNRIISERYSDVLWIKNYLWWKNSVLIIREWTLCTLRKTMGNFREHFVYFPFFGKYTKITRNVLTIFPSVYGFLLQCTVNCWYTFFINITFF